MPELGYEFDDGKGYRELNLHLVRLSVDGVTVWEKNTPTQAGAFDSHAAALQLQREMFNQWRDDRSVRHPAIGGGFADPKAQALYDALCAYTAPVPKPKERVRVHREREYLTFLKEDGEFDVYLPDIYDPLWGRSPRYFPATYEER